MRHFIALLTMVVAATTVLFHADGFAQNVSQSSINRIKTKGHLTVAVYYESVEPFFFNNTNGELVGIDPLLVRDIASKLGVTVVFNRYAHTFDGVIAEVAAGRADMAIGLLSDTLERAEKVTFSDSYADVRQFLLINRLAYSKLAQLEERGAHDERWLLNNQNARFGVISGSSYASFVRDDFPRAAREEFGSFAEMLAALKKGKLTALLYDEIQIGAWRKSDPAGSVDLRPVLLDGRPDTIAIAINHADQDLVTWTNLYLKKSRDNGFLTSLISRYLQTPDAQDTQ